LTPADGVPPGAICVGGLSEAACGIRRVAIPLAAAGPARKVLPSLLDVQLPFSLESCVWDCAALEREAAGAGWIATVAAARLEAAQARLAQGAAAGREPHLLDQEGLALWTQAVQECPPRLPQEPRAVVYLGADRAVLAMGRGRTLAVTQGFRQVDAESACRLARLAFGGSEEGVHWIWSGPQAARADALATLRAGLAGTAALTETVVPDPRAILARAYAVRALTPGPLRCNLRMGPLVHPGVRRRLARRAMWDAAAWLGAGLIVLAAGIGWHAGLAQREEAARAAVVRRARATVDRLGGGAVIPGYEGRSVSNALAAAAARDEPFARMREPSRVGPLGGMLAAARDSRVAIRRLAWTDASFRLDGYAETADAVGAFTRRVAQELGIETIGRTDRKETHGVRFILETPPGP